MSFMFLPATKLNSLLIQATVGRVGGAGAGLRQPCPRAHCSPVRHDKVEKEEVVFLFSSYVSFYFYFVCFYFFSLFFDLCFFLFVFVSFVFVSFCFLCFLLFPLFPVSCFLFISFLFVCFLRSKTVVFQVCDSSVKMY